ncbi:MAG TPA: ATP-binding protein [Thermodesulfovibrionia bacterium]|nr:ATP-binding protein [Thermodesulfovibrionia bacterium]
MTPVNPYVHGKPLPHDSEMFFGRRSELDNIISLLSTESPQDVSIYGERRIGKSSFVLRAVYRAGFKKNVIVGYLGCNSLKQDTACDSLFQILNEKIIHIHKNDLKNEQALTNVLQEGKIFDSFSSFQHFIEHQGRGQKVILFLDEFESLFKCNFANAIFFNQLRSLADSSSLAYVTVSQKKLKDLTDFPEFHSSPFWNKFNEIPLGLLDDSDALALKKYGFDKYGITLTDNDLDFIDYYAGNFPFFIQILCSHLFNEKVFNSKRDKDKIESALIDHYKALWKYRSDEEKVLLKKLIDTPVNDELTTLSDLKNRGLLIRQDDQFYPFSEFFARLIRYEFTKEKKKLNWDAIIKIIRDVLSIGRYFKDLTKK